MVNSEPLQGPGSFQGVVLLLRKVWATDSRRVQCVPGPPEGRYGVGVGGGGGAQS